ncbi:iron complex transport system ATP-binding protein [Kineosphaera limosa]|uniref:Putative ABC transporter ATP-binding protein n=1 Tax=Kineosphaera limosa NBRC 100340 TaxID=1184609 RepID=K6W6X7_9MICO|nr:ABC transporter ATP-binding protein [Kineosphaera limosa]NYE00584.1 iron complex transport system ATP-binding protein [Kineosphaera limosa]GAB94950.1 putative ABC transporter ATP-binding protein [Kineosphaera limosa NBRC 100340]
MRVTTQSLGWSAGRGREAVPVLRPLDVAVEPGRLTGVVGPNGSGKTTLLHLIAGLRRPTQGTVHYAEADAARLSSRRRAQLVALVEQHPQTTLELTVRQVVELGRIPHVGRWPGSKDGDADAVAQALAVASVGHLAHRKWPTLSGGERQRAQLARAIAQRPRLLLLDEPTNHLDLRHQIALLQTVAGLGVTTVAVLHDLDLAAAFCDDLVVLDEGRLVAAGPTAQVLSERLVAEVFSVRARVQHTDRLRMSWSGLVRPDQLEGAW